MVKPKAKYFNQKRNGLGGGHWDFRFCGFGYFLDRCFGFCAKRLRFFGFGVHCGLQIFRFISIWFSVFVEVTCGFSGLLCDVVFGFSYFVLFVVFGFA